MDTPAANALLNTPTDIASSESDWEDYGHFLAYYAIPHKGTLSSVLNTGMKNGIPYPSVLKDPTEIFTSVNNNKVYYIRFSDTDCLRSIRGAMIRKAAEGDALLFRHWMDDMSTQKFIHWIHAIEGNWGSAPTGYLVGWFTIQITSLIIYYQIKSLRWLWHLGDDIWKLADDW